MLVHGKCLWLMVLFFFLFFFFGEEEGYHVCDCICPSVSLLEDQRTTSYIIPQVPNS